ncbi:MAG: CHAT domain-containing protein [Myxococcales bacterium]|nr:CHAT domain-containing protein [Myxococcales bacterium]
MIRTLLVVGALLGCSAPPPPTPVAATLLGARAVLAPGIRVLGSRPRVRLAEAGPGPWSLRLLGAGVVDVPLVGAGPLLRPAEDVALPGGAGLVVLLRAGAPVARFFAIFSFDLHEIDEAVAAARAAPDPAAGWEAAAEAARAAGVGSEVSRALRAAAFHHLWARRFGTALARVEAATAVDAALDHGPGLALDEKYRGQILHKTGDHLGAERWLTAALRRAEALGDDDVAGVVARDVAGVLVNLGRADEAVARLRPLGAGLAGRARAEWLVNLAWAEQQGVRDADAAAAPRAHLAEARALFTTLGHPELAAPALANLAGLALQVGDLQAVRRHLGALAALPGADDAFPRGHAGLVEAELALRTGDAAGADARFREVLALAATEADLGWRAQHGLGRVALRQGDAAAARARFEAALAELWASAARTALTSSRAPFLASRRAVADDLVALLLAGGEAEAALAVADADRAHVLRALEAQARLDRLDAPGRAAFAAALDRYQRARDALEARARGRDLVRPADLPAWDAGLARDRDDLAGLLAAAYAHVEAPAPPPPRDLASVRAALGPGEAVYTVVAGQAFVTTREAAAEPFDPTTFSATHTYVVGDAPPPAAAGGRVSRLPWAGVLAAARPATAPPLVVADPALDLRHARQEGAAVAADLGGRLLVGDAADREAVAAALPGARVFHFAGHGALSDASPWEAHLRLAHDQRLTLADVLALRPALGLVVLSGCETGRAGALSATERVGLPDAFLAAGARSVLATTVVVDDARTAAFMAAFYRLDGARHPGPALAAALAERRAAGDELAGVFTLSGRP